MTLELAALGAVLMTPETVQFTAACEDRVMWVLKYRYNDLVCVVCITTLERGIPVHVTAGAAPGTAVSNRRSLIEMRLISALPKFGESQKETLMLTFVA